MATYAITFRISDKGDHADRYQSFLSYVTTANKSETPWVETTSFLLITSGLSAKQLADYLINSKVNQYSGDKFAVIDVANKTAAHYGLEYPLVFNSFFE